MMSFAESKTLQVDENNSFFFKKSPPLADRGHYHRIMGFEIYKIINWRVSETVWSYSIE